MRAVIPTSQLIDRRIEDIAHMLSVRSSANLCRFLRGSGNLQFTGRTDL